MTLTINTANGGRAGLKLVKELPEGVVQPGTIIKVDNSLWGCVYPTTEQPGPESAHWTRVIDGIPPGPDGYLLSSDGTSLIWSASPYGKPVSQPVTWYIRPDGNDAAAAALYMADPTAGANTSAGAFRSLYTAWQFFAENFFLTGQGGVKFQLGVPGTYEDESPVYYLPISVMSPGNITDMDGPIPRRRISIVGDRGNPAGYVYKYSSTGGRFMSMDGECFLEGVTLLLTTAAGHARSGYGILLSVTSSIVLWDCILTTSGGPFGALVSARGSLQTYGSLTINNYTSPASSIFECGAGGGLVFDRSDSGTTISAGRITINGNSSDFNGAVLHVTNSSSVFVLGSVTWAGTVPSAKRYAVANFSMLDTGGRLTAIPGLAGTVDTASYGVAK